LNRQFSGVSRWFLEREDEALEAPLSEFGRFSVTSIPNCGGSKKIPRIFRGGLFAYLQCPIRHAKKRTEEQSSGV
jgi:hypothetical protein